MFRIKASELQINEIYFANRKITLKSCRADMRYLALESSRVERSHRKVFPFSVWLKMEY